MGRRLRCGSTARLVPDRLTTPRRKRRSPAGGSLAGITPGTSSRTRPEISRAARGQQVVCQQKNRLAGGAIRTRDMCSPLTLHAALQPGCLRRITTKRLREASDQRSRSSATDPSRPTCPPLPAWSPAGPGPQELPKAPADLCTLIGGRRGSSPSGGVVVF